MSLEGAAKLAKAGRYEEAWKIVGAILLENPLDARALVTGSFIMLKLGGLAQAYHFARAATQLLPNDDAAWTNLGHAASQMWLVDDAEACYMQALRVARNEEHKKVLWLNLSALYVDNGEFEKAEEWTDRILAVDPTHHNALANRGFCRLARRDWSGWEGYHNTIGSDWRPKVQYRDEPEWDGSPGKVVALYADQGLGDEISFASMLPDAAVICKKLIVDCDPRLQGLFRRSFPDVKVYGTRKVHEHQTVKWDREDWDIDCSLAMGQIGEFFRLTPESFPGTAYLVPCPDRVRQWKALFASKGKPAIGIAWTGGIPKTNARNRRLGLEDLLPLFQGVDAHFVSLQYKDAAAEIAPFVARYGVDLVQYPWGTLTADYDDTAALTASLDYVLCIQTAIAHTAGALGTAATVLVPKATQWRYGSHGDSIPWYHSLRVIRQEQHGHWRGEIKRATREIKAYLGGLPRPAAGTARDERLRHGVDRIRANGHAGGEPAAGDARA